MIEATTDVCKSMSDRSERSIYRSSSRCIIVINTMSIDKPYIIRRIDSGNTNLSRFAPGNCACRVCAQDVLSINTNYTSRVIQRGDETRGNKCGGGNTNLSYQVSNRKVSSKTSSDLSVFNISVGEINGDDGSSSTNRVGYCQTSDVYIFSIQGLNIDRSDSGISTNLRCDDASSNLGINNVTFGGIDSCNCSSSADNISYC